MTESTSWLFLCPTVSATTLLRVWALGLGQRGALALSDSWLQLVAPRPCMRWLPWLNISPLGVQELLRRTGSCAAVTTPAAEVWTLDGTLQWQSVAVTHGRKRGTHRRAGTGGTDLEASGGNLTAKGGASGKGGEGWVLSKAGREVSWPATREHLNTYLTPGLVALFLVVYMQAIFANSLLCGAVSSSLCPAPTRCMHANGPLF